ncbi:MAG TPA: HEAT repeat domain-containing protein [Candidatus Eisenbacteria bacterium]
MPQGLSATGARSRTEPVAAFLDLLIRTIETGRTSPRQDPALLALEGELEGSLRACLHLIGDFTIRVDELDFAFGGEPVYRSTSREGSLPLALFQDGVREISLRHGITSEEVSALVRALRRATDARERGWDDAVTLLWEQDLRHVDYVCLPSEESDLDGTPVGDGIDEAVGGASGNVPWSRDAAPEGEDAEAPPNGPDADRFDDWQLPGKPTAATPVGSDLSAPFRDIEAENIRMTASVDEAISPRDQVVAILSGVLDAETEPAAYFETASILGLFIRQAVAEGDFARANQLTEGLLGISTRKPGASGEFRAASERVVQEIGSPEFLKELSPFFNARPEVDLGELSKFLARLGSSAAPALCDLLSEIQVRKVRRAICEALAISCKTDVAILIRQLSDSRWYVVRNVLYVLGRIAHQGVERALGDALYHEDIRVRREAICALAQVESARARAYLNSALRDPDKGIRLLVARLIARRRSDRAAQVIWSVIESPEFRERDAEERAAFFEVLGRTGSDALVPRLEQSLIRSWGRPRERIERREAALTLAWLGTPAALAVLKREAGSKRDEVRSAVAAALEDLRKGAPKDPGADWGR